MKRRLFAAGALLFASMGTTVVLMALEGGLRQVIPLHLCSISALFAMALAFGVRSRLLMNFLWYLGIPGAALALLFPAPALSRFQLLLNASYVTTHTLIIAVPLMCMRSETKPQPGGGVEAMMLLQGAALCAFAVNKRLGTDFMFLSAPPAASPLEIVYRYGYSVYIVFLQALMFGVCLLMGAVLDVLHRIKASLFDQ